MTTVKRGVRIKPFYKEYAEYSLSGELLEPLCVGRTWVVWCVGPMLSFMGGDLPGLGTQVASLTREEMRESALTGLITVRLHNLCSRLYEGFSLK